VKDCALPLLLFAGLLAPGARGVDPCAGRAAAAPQVRALIDQLGTRNTIGARTRPRNSRRSASPPRPALKEALNSGRSTRSSPVRGR